ncbi:hypothetical protein [Clostridium massiliamazoniense]|uniref:hypothetical protein n=1 Tax=Clostridium massiliamazoniense TaxID=1347366 RepID=UPI0006D7C7B0|nr:hypothetical protein [Clostridium massiliamazoniense]
MINEQLISIKNRVSALTREEYIWGLTECNQTGTISCAIWDTEYNIITNFNTKEIAEFNNFDEVTIVQELIISLYREEINWRKESIKFLKQQQQSKIKSLATWYKRNNKDKVESITKELVEAHNTIEQEKKKVAYFKNFINNFYTVKKQLEDYEWLLS